MNTTLRSLFIPQPKSKVRAGEGLELGKYRFFTSSSVQSKFFDDYQYDEEALIFGTGGTASVHYCNEPFATSTDCIVVYGNGDVNLKMVFYYLSGQIHLLQNGFKGAGLQHISKDYILNIPIDLPDRNAQDKIVKTIDKVEIIIEILNRKLFLFDEIVKSRFVEMFGDSIENDKKWDCFLLCEVSDIVSGITKGRKVRETKLIEVPYMAVSNVKDGYIDWTTVKTILATTSEIEQYRILPEDILMTEGGDPDKLGRGAIIHQVPENCIHQNHIFRVRLDEAIVLPVYFSEYLQAQKAKRYFFGCAKQTTGIASINMKQLKALPVLVPPLELQEQFAAFVEQTDKSKYEHENSKLFPLFITIFMISYIILRDISEYIFWNETKYFIWRVFQCQRYLCSLELLCECKVKKVENITNRIFTLYMGMMKL